jgi:hypothetical protein
MPACWPLAAAAAFFPAVFFPSLSENVSKMRNERDDERNGEREMREK